jgi:hypothetical protein
MSRIALTTPVRSNPIICELGNFSNGVLLVSAVSSDTSGNSQSLTLAADQRSFSLPASKVGLFSVAAVINNLPPGPSPQLVEQGGPLLDVFDDPATLSALFQMVVTA